MNYLDAGYSEFLERSDAQNRQVDIVEADSISSEIPGSRVVGGALVSPNGRVQLDLETGRFKVNDGAQDRVILGYLPDGSVGLLLQDVDGKKLMQISGDTNIIQSADQKFLLDFINKKLLISNIENQVVLDENGLSSTTNFQSSTLYATSTQTTTSTTLVDVPGFYTSFNIKRESQVLFITTVAGNADDNNGIAVVITIDGEGLRPALQIQGYLGAPGYGAGAIHVLKKLSAGTHTMKLQFCCSSGTGGVTSTISTRRLTYVVLGS